MTDAKTLAEALPLEQARCRELLVAYKEIGPAGAFGAVVIEEALRQADVASASGDVVAMIRSYQELKGLE